MYDLRKRILVIFSLTLLFLIIVSGVAFAGVLDQVNLEFDKEVYSTVDYGTVKIGFTLENNNNVPVNLRLYTNCDDDELSCNYSQVFSLLGTTSVTSSLNVKPQDNGSSTLTIYVKDLNTGDVDSYNVTVYSDDGLDDGKFEIDIDGSSLCKDQENQFYFIINNNYTSDLYDITIVSNQLTASSDFINPIYLSGNEKELHFNIALSSQVDIDSTINATLKIYNDRITVNKPLSFYVRDCSLEMYDFQVTGPNTNNFVLKKENKLYLDYVIKNISTKTKDFFVSYDSNSEIEYNLSTTQIRLGPGESKKVTLSAYAIRDISSGSYPLHLQFFDEKSVITKKLNFYVDPLFNLDVRTTQSSLALNIGQTSDLLIILENKGDIEETFNLTYNLTNDLKLYNDVEKITVLPHSTKSINLRVSAGSNTREMTSKITIEVNGEISSFSKTLFVDVVAFKGGQIIKLNYLSFPREITIDSNSEKNFSFEVYNFGEEDITLSAIDLVGVPQEISISLPSNIIIRKSESRVISGTIRVEEISSQTINANFVLTSDKGGVLASPIKIIIGSGEYIAPENEEGTKIPVTGFFTFRNSLFFGIVGLIIIIILLFLLGVFKRRRDYSSKLRR